MKAFVCCALFSLLALVIAEPPTGGYLPPRTGNAGGFGSDRRGLGGYTGSGSGFGGGFQSGSGSGFGGGFQSGSGSGFGGGYQSGSGSGFGGGYGGAGDGPSEPANYEFNYEVRDAAFGNNFGHSEARKEDVAQGKYFVLLPDGRTLIVDYTADESGYHPIVKYEGEARADAGAGFRGAGGYSGGAGGYSGGAGGFGGGAGYSGGFQQGGAGSGSFDSASGYKY